MAALLEKDLIKITCKGKRSWRKFKGMMKAMGYDIDLRKSSKDNCPLYLECSCGNSMEIKKVKDFPLKDKKCKCGTYFIRWI